MTTYRLSTDSGTTTVTADSVDAAAVELARIERIRGVATAADLRDAIERAGGYGTLTEDGAPVWRIGA